jgi:hypothetical protein
MSETLGERRARKYAALALRYRLEAEVKVEARPAEYWEDGGLKYPASVISSVAIREPGLFGDYVTYAWRTVEPGQGQKATTRGLPGIKIRGAAVKRQSVIRFGNEADFRRALSLYDYREDSPANVLRRIDFHDAADGSALTFRDAEREVAETLVTEGYLVRDGDGYAIAPAVDRRYGTYRLPK